MVDLGNVFHLEAPRMKHEENSYRGIREAIERGFDSIDLDMSRCKSSSGVPGRGKCDGNHWSHPMERDGFVDPSHRMPRDKRFADMSPKQVERLHTADGTVIRPIGELIPFMAKQITAHGDPLKGRLEPKPGYVWDLAFFRHLHETVEASHAIVVITTLDTYRTWRDTLNNARDAGFTDVRRLRG